MKKFTMVATGLVAAGAIGAGAYLMMNKKARKKTEAIIDNAVDDATNYFKNS